MNIGHMIRRIAEVVAVALIAAVIMGARVIMRFGARGVVMDAGISALPETMLGWAIMIGSRRGGSQRGSVA